MEASGDNSDKAREALQHLCTVYWYPLYAYVRRGGKSPHDAQDLTQEFFARLLEKNWLGAVDRARGRFRSWLLTAMKYFLVDEWHKSRTLKRGGSQGVLSLDAAAAESRYQHEPADLTTADKLYDRRWAFTLLDAVLVRLQAEYAGAKKGALFEALKPAITGERAAYAEIAAQCGMSEGAVRVATHRLRERYRDLIRQEIAETVATPGEVDEELRYLFAALNG